MTEQDKDKGLQRPEGNPKEIDLTTIPTNALADELERRLAASSSRDEVWGIRNRIHDVASHSTKLGVFPSEGNRPALLQQFAKEELTAAGIPIVTLDHQYFGFRKEPVPCKIVGKLGQITFYRMPNCSYCMFVPEGFDFNRILDERVAAEEREDKYSRLRKFNGITKGTLYAENEEEGRGKIKFVIHNPQGLKAVADLIKTEGFDM